MVKIRRWDMNVLCLGTITLNNVLMKIIVYKSFYIAILFFSGKCLKPIMLPWITSLLPSWSGILVWWEWLPFTGKAHCDSSRHISLWSVPSWPWYLSSTSQNGLRGSSWLWFQYMVKPRLTFCYRNTSLVCFPSSSSYLDLWKMVMAISHNSSVNN